MALLNFLKPKNQLEEGGRTAAPVQRDAGEPEKNCPNCHKDIPLSRLWANFSLLSAQSPVRLQSPCGKQRKRGSCMRYCCHWQTKMLPVRYGIVFYDGQYGQCRWGKNNVAV